MKKKSLIVAIPRKLFEGDPNIILHETFHYISHCMYFWFFALVQRDLKIYTYVYCIVYKGVAMFGVTQFNATDLTIVTYLGQGWDYENK